MPLCLIGLGSNQGDRREILDAAFAAFAADGRIGVVARSGWRETAAVGGPVGQPPYLNGAALMETSLAPEELLRSLQQIEDGCGRRRQERWGPRTLDLDLLLYGELVLNTPLLVLPHPRLAVRRFVLEPAAEVAPAMRHPTIGWNIARLLEHLNTSAAYVAITGPIAVGKSDLASRLTPALSGRLIKEQPNWARLGAFYADPASHSWPMELEFLIERAALLAAGAAAWQRRQWVVSDFWFDQSAAFARAWLPADRFEAYRKRFDRLRQTVVQPRLIVLLDVPTEELLTRIVRRGRACESRLTIEQLAAIRQSIEEQAVYPELGPVLRLKSEDQNEILSEVLAAVRGME